MHSRSITENSSYLDKLVNLIPTEFVAAYLAIHNTVLTAIPEEDTQTLTLLISGSILAITIPFYFVYSIQIRNKRQIVVSSLSFLIWVVSLGGILESFNWYYPVYSTIAIILWTLISPQMVQHETV
jgi:cation transport ATPase